MRPLPPPHDFPVPANQAPPKTTDAVNHPPHYNAHPSGIECIDVVEHMNFNLGNAIKYIWRCSLKGDAIEDLRKAAFYIAREIDRRERTRCVFEPDERDK
jgi:hypothetical protein